MSITSAKTGSTGLSLALDNNYMEPIATVLVGSGGTNQITFNDIPQGYKHLQIRAVGQVIYDTSPGGAGGLATQFNNDSGSNYTRQLLAANGGGTVEAYGIAPQSFGLIERFNWVVTNDNIYAAAICDILDYSSTTKHKTARNIGGFDKNGTASFAGEVYSNAFLWRDTSPITSIKLLAGGGYSLRQHSRFSLYGIKG